ncbi:hypothetical protein Pyn_20160 [Prunus yedoensis var. nudiflora]|uniref:Uncharacterized protein n=1 Tax=Prunus yedoensis var. nudiflora TaxID=2094558 RepID=A0A314YPZ6_PRUYE|nr:hypothetical protein Pyn_20160 [Prunus yedoensis var. nudiflora]
MASAEIADIEFRCFVSALLWITDMRHWREPFPPPQRQGHAERDPRMPEASFETFDLFGCALAHVGVMDLLWFPRIYHRFLMLSFGPAKLFQHGDHGNNMEANLTTIYQDHDD